MKQKEISLATKKALAAALKRLMVNKPISKITVRELVAECGINRNSFYYHFEDIYALFKWMVESEAVEIVKQYDLMMDYHEVVSFVLDYVENNQYLPGGSEALSISGFYFVPRQPDRSGRTHAGHRAGRGLSGIPLRILR